MVVEQGRAIQRAAALQVVATVIRRVCIRVVAGLGFASALSVKGLQEGALVQSLLAFNLGVEAGQLFVAAVVAALLLSVRMRGFYPRFVLTPACALIGLVGAFWFIERIT